MRHRFALVCALVASSFVFAQSLAARAGTTGGISGVVSVADTSAPIANARVTVTSPSETSSTRTDATGHFGFVSLAPDTYTVSVEREGYDPASLSGVNVLADATQTLAVSLRKALREIGRVTARSASDLIKPGTTADVYSVGAAQQDRVSALGGGGSLNSAYSAIASVPGAYVPANQSGYLQAVHIRGGDSDQVGYEFDGIPVNRAFDNYPSASASSLGQLELQVYTGASPATAEAQGLAGFVNQVIRVGTFPGFSNIQLDLGGPTFYHNFNFELGGATPRRTFSYYVGIGGFNQDFRYVDQFSGASYANAFGPIIDSCLPNPPASAPSCFTNGKPNVGAAGSTGFILGPVDFGNLSAQNAIRTTVVNLHFGIPHHHDGGKDDIQILYDVDQIYTTLFSSATDAIVANLLAAPPRTPPVLQVPSYLDSWQYTGKLGALLPANYSSLVVPYLFPSSPQNRPLNAAIPLNERDRGYNQQAIVKLQYQKNLGSQAYLRLYGYTYYSDYIGTGPNSSWQNFTGFDSGDYELNAHTRGLSATFADQITPKHLLNLQASYTTSRALRMYNTQMFGSGDSFAVLVNPNDVTHGICYAAPPSSSGGAATPTTCNNGNTLSVGLSPTFASLAGIGGCSYGPKQSCSLPPSVNGLTCGGRPCAYYVVENGQYGEYNLVRPNFYGYSLTDQFKPTDRLLINGGFRLDQYGFTGDNTTATPARTFWFDSFNHDTCYDTANTNVYDKTSLANGQPIPGGVTAPCSAGGKQYVPATLFNTPNQQFTYSILQPRLGATYSLSPDTVLRASFGKYVEQPSSAYEQYDALQQNLPDLLGPGFYSYGFNTPGHEVRPSISYNSDFSLERHVRGTDLSFKLSPFYRKTQDQIENFFLNVKAGLISGLNVARQTSQGFELEVTKGDFDRNGLAGQLSFAYTNSFVNFNSLPNGTSIVSSINGDIQQYNAYTSFCAGHPGDPRCGLPTNGKTASPCYVATGSSSSGLPTSAAPSPCGAVGAYANPYWNAPVQSLLDPGANYLPYSTFPAGIGTGANSFVVPYVATLIVNYKRDRLSITPSFQFAAGGRFGAPETMPGIDPAAGCLPLTGASIAGDPRYPYGAPSGAPYDGHNCSFTTLAAIPDSFTGHFDGVGQFRDPAQFLAHLRVSYKVTSRVELVATFANVIDRCFGGQQTAFTYLSGSSVCNWTTLTNATSPVGNVYNPHDNVQTFLRYPYEPSFGAYNDLSSSTVQPFSAYLSLRVKL